MGQAFDRSGNVLGEMFGATKSEVFEKLNAQFKDAHEIRVRTIEGNSAAHVEMPRYKSHKVVHALKIASVTLDADVARVEGRETDGSAVLHPLDREHYAPFRVDSAFVRKHSPQGEFYYVVYAPDGYASLSPVKAFEDGYTRL